jgi:hypothetical protein
MKPKMITRDQSGGAVVEFAIILPLLIFLLFGIIEGSLLLYNQQVITNACREGARAGIVVRSPTRLSDAKIKEVVDKYADQYLVTFGTKNFPPPVITRAGENFGDDLSVEITYDYDFLVLFNPITFSKFDPIPLKARTVMKME